MDNISVSEFSRLIRGRRPSVEVIQEVSQMDDSDYLEVLLDEAKLHPEFDMETIFMYASLNNLITMITRGYDPTVMDNIALRRAIADRDLDKVDLLLNAIGEIYDPSLLYDAVKSEDVDITISIFDSLVDKRFISQSLVESILTGQKDLLVYMLNDPVVQRTIRGGSQLQKDLLIAGIGSDDDSILKIVIGIVDIKPFQNIIDNSYAELLHKYKTHMADVLEPFVSTPIIIKYEQAY